MVVDRIDGRTHHIAGIDPAHVEDARIVSVIEIGLPDTASRPSDRAIAAIAEGGVYRPSHYLELAKFEGRALRDRNQHVFRPTAHSIHKQPDRPR